MAKLLRFNGCATALLLQGGKAVTKTINMKTRKFYGVLALALSAGFAACNNDGDTTSSTDTVSTSTTTTDATTSTTDNTATTTATSTNNYAALADTFRTNSEAGNYLDPRTGKSMRIRIDTATGTRYNESTNQPVWRYVDKRTYKVYGGDDNNSMWDTVGTARMQNNRLEYLDSGSTDKWVNYDKRWKIKDDKLNNDWKMKSGDTKIKVSKDGDVKIKDESGKVKYDADDDKIKTDKEKE
jgi:hypothetical protein